MLMVFQDFEPNFHDQTFGEILVYKWHKRMRDNRLIKRINIDINVYSFNQIA